MGKTFKDNRDKYRTKFRDNKPSKHRFDFGKHRNASFDYEPEQTPNHRQFKVGDGA